MGVEKLVSVINLEVSHRTAGQDSTGSVDGSVDTVADATTTALVTLELPMSSRLFKQLAKLTGLRYLFQRLAREVYELSRTNLPQDQVRTIVPQFFSTFRAHLPLVPVADGLGSERC
jgi:hypothetical protein